MWGKGMSKIRVDAQTMAIAHPTRRALYEALRDSDEMSTVMLQEITGVTRYHLYHHLQSLESNELVENHRNQGRSRWWRVTSEIDTQATSSDTSGAAGSSELPEAAKQMLQNGAEAHLIPIPSTASDQIGAKKAVEEIASAFGVELDLPFTFMPNGILIIGPPRRG
jgi:DNA-binding transcriptional ArsR family regulator